MSTPHDSRPSRTRARYPDARTRGGSAERSSALLLAILLVPALASTLGAQRPTMVLEPHAGWMTPGRFYRGHVGDDNVSFASPQGDVTLEAAPAWGARLSARPAGSPWALTLGATTAETHAEVRTTGDGPDQYRVRAPARLTMIALGIARELRPAASRIGLTGRLASSVASTTFEPRRYFMGPGTPPSAEYFIAQGRKPWDRRYVSPGAEAGLDASVRLRGALAFVMSATGGAVRNETSGMATNGHDVTVAWTEARDAYWMPVVRLTIGIALTR